MKFIAHFIFCVVYAKALSALILSIGNFGLLRKAWKAKESNNTFLIAPSLLSANFTILGKEVHNVLTAGADLIHFDAMDNHFVSSLTIGPAVCQALRDCGVTKDIDVHLMAQPVDALIEAFARAGASYITFHPEASDDVSRSLRLIRSLGCKAGLAISPDTSVDICSSVLDQIDLILVMGVPPGRGGQTFIPNTLQKIRAVRKIIDDCGRSIRLSVDGGVNQHNIREIALTGADTFVAGSAIFKTPREEDSYRNSIEALRRELLGV